MSEYIITDQQLKTATEAYLEHELSRPITDVFISGDKLPQIVRCRDCENFESNYSDGAMFGASVCWGWDNGHDYPCFTHPDGFCHRGTRRDA